MFIFVQCLFTQHAFICPVISPCLGRLSSQRIHSSQPNWIPEPGQAEGLRGCTGKEEEQEGFPVPPPWALTVLRATVNVQAWTSECCSSPIHTNTCVSMPLHTYTYSHTLVLTYAHPNSAFSWGSREAQWACPYPWLPVLFQPVPFYYHLSTSHSWPLLAISIPLF